MAAPKGAAYLPATQTLLLDIDRDAPPPVIDTLAGMSFGPGPPNGRHGLALVSDNNVNRTQATSFLAFGMVP